MSKNNHTEDNRQLVQMLTDALIRVAVILFLAVMSVKIFAPFVGIMLWAVILAVALYPLHLSLANKMGGKPGRAASVIVLLGLLLIGAPTVMLGNSFASHLHTVYSDFEQGNMLIESPNASVAEWPLVGEKVYKVWHEAAADLPKLIEAARPQLTNVSKKILAITANTAATVFAFLGSLIVAGIIMANGTAGSNAMRNILVRFTSPVKGEQLQKLSVGTIRSVATGVIGVAFIQALLLGVGFVFAGVPGAGILAVIVMVIGILQLPALVITLPVIAYLWLAGDASTTSNIVFSIYIFVAGLADNVLKPMLLGRGVDAPMPVILLGALGGMVSAGMVGLFVGAVMLAIGYQVFMDWVAEPLADKSAGQPKAADSE